MNERIKQFAQEAGFKVDWQHEDIQAIKMARFEKFAELIVEECVAQCWTVSAIEHKGTVISECSKRMRKHFGVDV